MNESPTFQSSNLNHRTKILQIFYQKHTNTTKGFISNSESSSSHHRKRRSSSHNAIIDIIDEQGPPAGAGGLYPSTYSSQSRSRYIIYQLVLSVVLISASGARLCFAATCSLCPCNAPESCCLQLRWEPLRGLQNPTSLSFLIFSSISC